MEFSKDLLANSVSAVNQLPDSESVHFTYTEGAVKNVLFVGNSITRHAPNADIGWYGDWGMSASAEEKDYVHLAAAELSRRYGAINFCVTHASAWERAFTDDRILPERYTTARTFGADIVIIRIGENTDREKLKTEDFQAAYTKMVQFFAPRAEKIIVTDMFWKSPALDEPIRAAAEANGWTFVTIGDLGSRPEMKAIGLFEHSGVAGHPGDAGMRAIADRILEAL